MVPYTPPTFQSKAFNCPYCNAYSNFTWYTVEYENKYSRNNYNELQVSGCTNCSKLILWHNKKVLLPPSTGIMPPNTDLDPDIIDDYLEASAIVNNSPRGAAALLRLSIQKLCIQLGGKGDNINNDIADLVKNGLPIKIQQALDYVRVIGNNSVHPGKIDLKDDISTATKLFELINIIADVMITQPKEIDSLYSSLPESQIKAIEYRDRT